MKHLLRIISTVCIVHQLFLRYSVVQAVVLGIDIGSEFSKVALANPGKAFEVILDAHSQRKTQTAVSFYGDIREFGSVAMGQAIKHPSDVITAMTNFLGQNISEVQHLVNRFSPIHLTQEQNTSSVLLHIPSKNMTLSPEKVLSHYLKYLQNLVNLNQGLKAGAKYDAVFTVPQSFGMKQRQALLDASAISNIHVLKTISAAASAGLYHAIDLPVNYTGNKMILDIGSHYSQSCILNYNYTSLNPVTRKRTVTVLGCASTDKCGGRHFDEILASSMLDQALKKFGKKKDWPNDRLLQRFLSQAKHSKLILSTNKQTDFRIEDMIDGKDFSSKITRDQFEGMIKPQLKYIEEIINTALIISQLDKSSLDTIELIGGGSRVPAVSRQISKIKSQSTDIGQHLNSDEAPVLGAVLIAANVSSLFRIKPIKFVYKSDANYTLSVYEENDPSTPLRTKNIISIGNTWIDGLKTVTLKTCSNLKAKLVEKKYNSKPEILYEYHIKDVEEKCKESPYNNLGPAKIGFVFILSEARIIRLKDVIAQWEEIIIEETVSNTTVTSPSNDSVVLNETKNETLTDNTTQVKMENQTVKATTKSTTPAPKIKKHSISCEFTAAEYPPRKFSDLDIKEAKSELKKAEAHDTQFLKTRQIRNQIEERVYLLRSRLMENNDLYAVTTESFRAEAKKLIDPFEEWLYSEGPTSATEYLTSKMLELNEFMKEAEEKAQEVIEKSQIVYKINSYLENVNQKLLHLFDKKTYDIPQNILDAFNVSFSNFTEWISGIPEKANTTSVEMKDTLDKFASKFDEFVKEAESKLITTTSTIATSTQTVNITGIEEIDEGSIRGDEL